MFGWNVQCEQRVHISGRVFDVPCWSVLSGWLQLVGRERVVQCWKLLDCGQRREFILQCLSRWQILC